MHALISRKTVQEGQVIKDATRNNKLILIHPDDFVP